MDTAIATQMLSITESMLAMAQDKEWDELEKYERERQKIITSLRSNTQDDVLDVDEHTVGMVEKIVVMNKEICELSSTYYDENKQALLALRKGSKANQFYL